MKCTFFIIKTLSENCRKVHFLVKKNITMATYLAVLLHTTMFFFPCHIFVAKRSFLGSFFALHFPNVICQSNKVCVQWLLVSCIFCWKGWNFCRCCFWLFTVGVASWSFWRHAGHADSFFFVYSKQSALIWRLQFIAQNHQRLVNWLTLITAPNSFFICRDFPFYWQVRRDSRLWVRGNDVESCAGGRGEGERGPWQLSHSNKRLPLWMDTQRRGVGWGGGGLPHHTAAIDLSVRMLSCPLIWTG